MSFQQVPLDNFTDVFSATTELSSEAIGGQIVSVSDEFFAEAFHLLLVEPAPSLKGQFGSKGALYSGWETRRHNPAHDWCIIRLGTTGTISGFDIDTSHFNGNEAPQASVEILHGSPAEEPQVNDARWTEVLPRVDLGPNSRHLFTIPDSAAVNYVKLNMYPDGGIARFRVYGHVTPVFPSDSLELFDLAHVFAGGRLEYTSDQHFGVGSNLILPGRGKNMGCGWETKRSRIKGHKDWVIIKLGVAGILEHVEIDTEHFKGNFPESCEIHALFAETDVDWKTYEDRDWTVILSRTKLGPHRQHYFQLENTEGKAYTHIKFTIYPDGGLQRIRIMGRRSSGSSSVAGSSMPLSSSVDAAVSTAQETQSAVSTSTTTTIVPVLPLTPEAFAPFGQVIEAYNDDAAAPKGTKITPANGGTARKFHKLSLLESAYSPDVGATAGISIYRCQPLKEVAGDGTVELKVLERHQFTNQAFIPMGQGSGEGLNDPGHRYLVVVAKNGADDGPDLQNIRAFIASTAQGIVYRTGIWHQPMTVLGKAIDFACVETQIGDGSVADCEILELDGAASVLRLRIPKA
ncbi:putative allantoicase [Hypsizygus marmoreus]|uniref:Allantoicase n=1 Tax=Hypsizygus marmoreus TaxID=39966 RepID=A0A369K2Z7_HYPMA|nr:putative allantoicase [Hypsizygus marmoreus]